MATDRKPGDRLQSLLPLLHAKDGPLTRELLLAPSEFGLGQLPQGAQPDATTRMVCGYCSTGCSLDVHLRDGVAIGLSPTTEYPVNLGMACPKGWEALRVLDSPERATMPLLRNAKGKIEPVEWDVAIQTFVERMRAIQMQHGPHSVAFIGSGQLPTEDLAYLGSLAKFGMGMLHGDGNTRQCMASAVVAYKQAFGFDAPPYTYADFEQSDVIVLVGSNLCIAHPIMWERVMRNPHNPQIVVIDPRMTETAMAASQHLPVYPKSDLPLLYGVARILIERDWIDRDFLDKHTTGFAEFAAYVQQYTLERVAEETRLAPAAIERFAATIRQGERVSFWWTMGVNQSHQATRTAQAIINLALMTGNIGRPGTGANSITGQCNAMGSRLFSNTTNLLGGHDFGNPDHRRKVAGILKIDEANIPHEASWPYHQILEGVLRKQIRGLWIVGTNPAHSWINQNQIHDILDRLDFLVVQDMYSTTETAQRAHLLLPAAGWGEKEGTFINSERRLGVLKKVSKAPGKALADFSIFKLVAHYWGCGEMFAKWQTPQDVFQTLKELSAGQPCDYSGIADYLHLDAAGGIQWPYPAGNADTRPERRLFADGRFYHADGRARMLFEDPRRLPEEPTEKYPLILLTGRGSASQWHTQTRTGKSEVLRKLYPLEPFVEVNPEDARALRIRHGDTVTVASQRGRATAKAVLTHNVQPGHVFMAMHYASVNLLTHAAFDPHSSQPAYKACAVRVDGLR
jgi:assimilatory nitrate reductase catalytic subunit